MVLVVVLDVAEAVSVRALSPYRHMAVEIWEGTALEALVSLNFSSNLFFNIYSIFTILLNWSKISEFLKFLK